MEREPHVGHGFAVKRGVAELAIVALAFTGVVGNFEADGVRGELQVGLPEPVRAVAAPAVVRRVFDHAGANRVEFAVAHAREQVGFDLDER